MSFLLAIIGGLLAEALFRLEVRLTQDGWDARPLSWRDATRRAIGCLKS